jgi:1,4-alpha-glucan branching enzyme
MQWLNAEIDGQNRETGNRKISIAEDLQGNEWLTRPAHEGGAGFGSQWDPGFVHPVRRVLTAPHDSQRDLHALEGAILGRYNGDAFRRVIYTESHDEVAGEGLGKLRLPEEIHRGHADSWFARKRSTLGAVLVFTSPGIPMLFQGQEFLEYQTFTDHTPLDWFKAARYSGILSLYRDLIRLRRNWYDHTRGLRGQHVHVHHVNNTDKVLAFHRWAQGGPRDDVVVVLNLADRAYDSYTLGFPRPGEWKVRFNSDWSGYSSDFGSHPGYHTTAGWERRDRMPCSGNVGIGPYSALILSQDG